MNTAFELEAVLRGVLKSSSHDHDLIAQAVNECLAAIGQHRPVAYLADDTTLNHEKGTT